MKVNQTAYSLVDSGRGQKLEKFGPYLLIRPEPIALWSPATRNAEWEKIAHARFVPHKKEQSGINRGGNWEKLEPLPDEWAVHFKVEGRDFQFRVAPSPFGHVALFPEQHANWQFLAQQIKQFQSPAPRVLNLFAYTGAASVVARAFGADVVHVDSSRPILNQARQNMEMNGLADIRWVYEDALKFVRREAKRGHLYQGIILDPPPSGRGPSGEKWTIDSLLQSLLEQCGKILAPKESFLSMSLYAHGWAPEEGARKLSEIFPHDLVTADKLVLLPTTGNSVLPQGSYTRLVR